MRLMGSKHAFDYCINELDFNTVLDIGCGDKCHTNEFIKYGKTVSSNDIAIDGDYIDVNFPKHDLTWCSHVLEHQLNVNMFLQKMKRETSLYACITVPPLKHSIVGGHVTLWNAGLLLYNMVLAGFDCSDARIKQHDYNITVIARPGDFTLPKLNYDKGDIKKILPWLPEFCDEPFDGDISEWNW